MMKKIIKILKYVLLCLGGVFVLMIGLAFTSVPFYAHYNLGATRVDTITMKMTPEEVVMFGGASMPSQDNLMRLYYTASIARQFQIPVMLVHPEDSVCQSEMTRLLNNGGIDSICYLTEGTNTRSQVLFLKEIHPDLLKKPFVVVTSPEHLRRTVKCLQKVGFEHVIGVAAYEAPVNFDLSLKEQKLGGRESIPSVESTKMRYTVFNYLKLEIICFREYIALAYYKLKRWI